ncbi:MAG TPA: YdcF family protein [Xanthomonadales bacterium]|nr:YdcF family protein [Xanthomonadales bacterium]
MYLYLSKILPLLVMPLGLVLLLGLLALACWLLGKRRMSGACGLLALLLLWISSTPFVAESLYGRLEASFPPQPLTQIPASSCIIVLGGAVGLPLAPREDIELTEAVDRVHKAVQLYRAGKGGRVFVTAGNQPGSPPGPSEAALIGELLVEWGVPADAIQLEGNSRNTRENALNLKPLIESGGCDRSLLVTSAAHMQRAVAAFKAAGLYVYPVSTDVRVLHDTGHALVEFLPDAHALAMTSDAIREWLGQRVYEWNGWN